MSATHPRSELERLREDLRRAKEHSNALIKVINTAQEVSKQELEGINLQELTQNLWDVSDRIIKIATKHYNIKKLPDIENNSIPLESLANWGMREDFLLALEAVINDAGDRGALSIHVFRAAIYKILWKRVFAGRHHKFGLGKVVDEYFAVMFDYLEDPNEFTRSWIRGAEISTKESVEERSRCEAGRWRLPTAVTAANLVMAGNLRVVEEQAREIAWEIEDVLRPAFAPASALSLDELREELFELGNCAIRCAVRLSCYKYRCWLESPAPANYTLSRENTVVCYVRDGAKDYSEIDFVCFGGFRGENAKRQVHDSDWKVEVVAK